MKTRMGWMRFSHPSACGGRIVRCSSSSRLLSRLWTILWTMTATHERFETKGHVPAHASARSSTRASTLQQVPLVPTCFQGSALQPSAAIVLLQLAQQPSVNCLCASQATALHVREMPEHLHSAGELPQVVSPPPQAHALPLTEDLPEVLAQLRSCSFQQQLPCSVPATCWSTRLCVEGEAHMHGARLTRTQPFQHAFELLCSCLLASSVDVVCSMLPRVADAASLQQARGSVQVVLEELLTCAPTALSGTIRLHCSCLVRCAR